MSCQNVFTTLLVIISLSWGCKTDGPIDSSVQENTWGFKKNDGWNQYMSKFMGNEHSFQKHCFPKSYEAKGTVKGSVVLLHGFTACNQQYEDLAPLLAAKGYHVYLPVLPGHGKRRVLDDGSVNTEYREIPKVASGGEKEYERFLAEMQAVFEGSGKPNVPHERIIGGLSLGGMLTARFITKFEVDKAMIMVPFFSLQGVIKRVSERVYGTVTEVAELKQALEVFAKTHDLAELERQNIDRLDSTWGEGCIREAENGRHGYCDFSLSSVALMHVYGNYTADRKIKGDPKVLLLGVEKDNTISNQVIADFAKNNNFQGLENRQGCFYRQPMPHSFLSKYDNPDKPKTWLPSVLKHLEDFFVDGQFPPISSNAIELGFSACEL